MPQAQKLRYPKTLVPSCVSQAEAIRFRPGCRRDGRGRPHAAIPRALADRASDMGCFSSKGLGVVRSTPVLKFQGLVGA